MKWNHDVVVAKLAVEVELLPRFQHPNRIEDLFGGRRRRGDIEASERNEKSKGKKFSHSRFWGFNASRITYRPANRKWISSFFISSTNDGRTRSWICSWPQSVTPTSGNRCLSSSCSPRSSSADSERAPASPVC